MYSETVFEYVSVNLVISHLYGLIVNATYFSFCFAGDKEGELFIIAPNKLNT